MVIAAWTGAEALGRCLASLRRQEPRVDFEVVVARNFDVGAATALAECPGSVDVPLERGATVPELRGAGLRRSTGLVVAFLEDHAVCVPGWVAALLRAHAAPVAAVGGPVECGEGASPLDWAVYFYDYGRYMSPIAAGERADLSGLNMSFKRSALDAAADAVRDGVFEDRLLGAIRAGHGTLWLEPGAAVLHDRRHGAAEATLRAYHLARGFAARRVAGAGAARRLAFAFAAFGLPALSLARCGLGVLRRRRHVEKFARALPWLAVLVAFWSAGECLGYLAGPGSSGGRWR